MKLIVCGVVAVLALSACASSAPVRFYTLSATAPAQGSASTPNALSGLRVTRAKIPGEIDRTEIVQRLDANRLSIAEQDRWAAPLDEMIKRVLTADLQSRAGPAASADVTVSVDVEEFVGDTTCAVKLSVSWEQKSTDAAHTRNGHEVINVPAPSSSPCAPGALPAVMSEALAQLSQRILSN